MVRWIVSLSALLVVASAFANPKDSFFDYGNSKNSGSTFCNTDNNNTYCDNNNKTYCNPNPTDCNPKPPTNCVPEPTSMAALAIGGIGFLRRKRKKA